MSYSPNLVAAILQKGVGPVVSVWIDWHVVVVPYLCPLLLESSRLVSLGIQNLEQLVLSRVPVNLIGPKVKAVKGSGLVGPDEGRVWSPTQFYSVDFSQSRISVEKCTFYKHTIRVCISCF